MLVLGTHVFNTMRHFAGDVAWISGHVTAGGREIGPGDAREATEPIGLIAGDAVTGYYSFAGGAVGSFTSRANQPGDGRGFSLQLIGDRGSVAMRGAGNDFVIARHDHWAPWDGIDGWDPLDLGAGELHKDGNRLAIEDLIVGCAFPEGEQGFNLVTLGTDGGLLARAAATDLAAARRTAEAAREQTGY